MKLYADSARVEEVVPMLQDGLIAGVTSNPTILHRDGRTRAELPELYEAFAEAGAGEIFMQATGGDRAQLLADAERIAAFGELAVVKLPATPAGFRVAATLVRRDVRVLLTAVYSLAQTAYAGSLGVDYIAPYYGRIVDSGADGLATITRMERILAPTRTRTLVASVRSAEAAATLALNGATHLTAGVPVLEAMLVDPETEATASEFERIAR
ncbi:hypothetical protein JD276_07315 [Leucobacter sp. CSA1]|uniref:Transaldolase n=1 Tax=Leucobacter chromiisoli TaxID=2796471 RepID=A0A934Q8M5_9MICO|nr:transaldolase family protein [Leucobacter chromiisoli]MBK0418842.1 hypothetical protein [Leucobacter chromiisoli]